MGCSYSIHKSINDEILEIEHASTNTGKKNKKNTETKKNCNSDYNVSMWG